VAGRKPAMAGCQAAAKKWTLLRDKLKKQKDRFTVNAKRCSPLGGGQGFWRKDSL